MKKFTYLKILNSPFKLFRLKWYIGKTQIGTPYFFPRKWVKLTEQEAKERADQAFNDLKGKPSYKNLLEYYRSYTKAVPLKVGFSSCDLGWKTKWTDKDIRFEWSPVYSFVFFGYQIALIISAPDDADAYWEAWLYYELRTDKTKSKRERIEQCKKEFPQTFTIYHKKPTNYTETVDKYKFILKKKYL